MKNFLQFFFSNKWKTGKGKKVKRSLSCYSLSNCNLVTGLRDDLDNLNTTFPWKAYKSPTL